MRGTRRAVAIVVTALTCALVAPPALLTASADGGGLVALDLRPGSADRKVNLRSSATLPVAVLSTSTFDATTLDVSTVCLGDRDNARQRDCTEPHGEGHPSDVDGDGDTDLLLHYQAQETGLDAGDTQICFEGLTEDGARVYGCDGVEVLNGEPEASPPDLTVSLSASPTTVDPHGSATWTAAVSNDGPGSSTLWPGTPLIRFTPDGGVTGVSVTAPSGYGCTTGSGGVVSCAPTAPDTVDVGTTRTFTYSAVMPDLPGVVNLRADADPTAAVAELDEADNRADAGVEVLAANLAAGLVAVPGAASPGEPLSWKATISSTGPGAVRVPAGTRLLDLALPAGLEGTSVVAPSGWSCGLAGAAWGCSPTTVLTLAVGDQVDVVLSAVAPRTPDSYEVAASVDPTAAVREIDETDNVAKAAVLVQLPNLLVSSVVAPDPVDEGERVTWTATMANAGPGRARIPGGATALRFTSSTDLVSPTASGPAGFTCTADGPRAFLCSSTAAVVLAAGDVLDFALTAALPQGVRTAEVTALADPDDVVVESDETDNSATSSVRSRLQDLAVTMSAAPDPVDAAHTVSWRASIRNDGTGVLSLPTGLVFTRFTHPQGMTNLFAATPAGYSCYIAAAQTVECATTTAIDLAAGSITEVTLGGTAPRTPGAITTSVQVDPSDLLAESDESNNAASTSVTVRPPDLSITLTGSPDPVDALASATWSSRITNDGPAAARVPTGTRVVRMAVPAGLVNLAVSSPANFTCFIESANVVDCQTTATLTLAAGAWWDITLFGTAPRQPGDITVTMTADPLDVLPEGDEGDNSASETITVRPPDFSIALVATPDPVDALASSTWSATITNDGPANARISNAMRVIRFHVPANLVNLAVSSPANFTCFIEAPQVVDCQSTATQNLAAGATYAFTLFGTAPRQPGPITTSVIADPIGLVPEVDETDNEAATTITVQPPDFSMTLNATPDPVDALGSSTWTATITNDGPANARISNAMRVIRFVVPANLVNLAVSSPPSFTCFIEAAQTVDCQSTATQNLAAGAQLVFTMFGTAPRTPGDITMTATADPLDVVPEGDETDNSAGETITVQPPDLSVAITPSATTVDARHSVSWATRVSNDGPANARISNAMRVIRFHVPANLVNLAVSSPPSFTCFIEAPQTVDCQSTATQNLAAGAHYDFTLFGTAPREAGPITVTATADPVNLVPEADEGDNAAASTVTVQVPDLTVSLASEPSSVTPEGAVVWTAGVRNDGPAAARLPSSPALVRITLPAGVTGAVATPPSGYACTAVDATTFDCAPASTVTLPVGGEVAFVVTGSAPAAAGSYTTTAVVDPSGAVPETDEGDNTASAPTTVT